MNPSAIRTGALVIAFVIGGLFPYLSSLDYLLQWNIILMLGITFLGLQLPKLKPNRLHLLLIAANILLGVAAWGILKLFGEPVWAEAAFFCGIAPMAASAPVIVKLMKGNVEFCVTALVLSQLAITAALPLLMPLVIGNVHEGFFFDIAGRVTSLLILPALAALVIRRIYPASRQWSGRLADISFALWIFSLILIAARAVSTISAIHIPWQAMAPVAAISFIVCATGFLLGYRIGYPHYKRECSQALGQKNTIITIYLAMTYADNTLVFLGPVFYVIYHNLFNALQMHLYYRSTTLSQPDTRPH